MPTEKKNQKAPQTHGARAGTAEHDDKVDGNGPPAPAPSIVETAQGRMVRTPAGGLIPEADFLAMTNPPSPPSDEQLEAECRRLGLPGPIPRESLRALARDVADFAVNPDHPLNRPSVEDQIIAAGPDGHSRRQKAEALAAEQVVRSMQEGAKGPRALPEIPALSSVHVTVAVEIGSAWIDRVRVHRTPDPVVLVGVEIGSAWIDRVRDEDLAISKVLHSIAVFHPEKAKILEGHKDKIRAAIWAWKRTVGRPGKNEATKWEAISALCDVVGILNREPETIRKAWQRSEK